MKSLRFLLLASLASSALLACGEDHPPADAGTPDGSAGMDATLGDDAGPTPDGGTDAQEPVIDSGTDGGEGGCGPECPPGFCFDGICALPADCCATGFCPGGMMCDFRSCGCITPTGCCATEPCATGEICSWDCTCVSESDCCFFGCPTMDPAIMCLDDCTCGVDPSCGTCPADTVCARGTCLPRCIFEGCADPSEFCGETGCTPALCLREDCIVADLECDPAVGCYDACEGDFSWCFSMGGYCRLGSCIDPSCSFGGCGYRYDCCGNAVCQHDSDPEPFCPTPCPPEPPYTPPRDDLCVCASGGWCQDLFGGGRPIPPGPIPVPPPRPPR